MESLYWGKIKTKALHLDFKRCGLIIEMVLLERLSVKKKKIYCENKVHIYNASIKTDMNISASIHFKK